MNPTSTTTTDSHPAHQPASSHTSTWWTFYSNRFLSSPPPLDLGSSSLAGLPRAAALTCGAPPLISTRARPNQKRSCQDTTSDTASQPCDLDGSSAAATEASFLLPRLFLLLLLQHHYKHPQKHGLLSITPPPFSVFFFSFFVGCLRGGLGRTAWG